MKRTIKETLLLILILFLAKSANAQLDTAFWFAAPDVSSAFNYDRPIMLRISSQQQSCVVTISQPANGGLPVQTISIPANSTQSVDLTNWINSVECSPGNTIQNRGIKILSTNKVAIYYEVNVNGPNPEIFALKGKNSLGTQFYISSQYLLDNTAIHVPTPTSSFNIVSTEDNTVVTINPKKNLIGHAANIPFTITLNRGQTYAAIAASTAAAEHLQGSYVSATKPVAVTLADDLLKGTAFGGVCEDLAGDQTVPISTIGTEYIAFKSSLNSPFDKVYITATENNTSVKQDGVLLTTLNAGQSAELSVINNTTYIQLSAPAYAYQLSGIVCEVGSAILPKINCTGSNSVSVVRSTNENFIITLLVKNGGQGNFLINNISGVITAGQFSVVAGTGGVWYAAKISLPLSSYPNGSIVRLNNSTQIFQLGMLEGGSASGAGFGYFSNFNTLQARAVSPNPNICAGNDLQLFADTIPSATYSWIGPNSFSSNVQNPRLSNASSSVSGRYIVNVTVPGCGSYYDSVDINIKQKSFSSISQAICQGQTYAGYRVSGTYIDTFILASGCDSIRTLALTVKQRSISTLNYSVCEGQKYDGHAIAGTYIDTLIAANGCDSIRTLHLTIKSRSFFTVSQSICKGQTYLGHNSTGTYSDTLVGANGCDSVRTLNLTVLPQIISTVNQSICKGQMYFGYGVTGTYIDTFISNTCDSVRILSLVVIDKPIPRLGADTALCLSDSFVISPGNFLSYKWQDSSIQNYFTVKRPGLYSVTVTNTCGSVQDNILITDKPCDVYFPNAFTPNNDGKNEVFKILNAFYLPGYYLAVYNRWGQKVFETKDYTKGWNGNFKGIPQNTGAYVWYCTFRKLNINNKLKGTVMLIR